MARRKLWPAVVGFLVLALAIYVFLAVSVDAHESWISRGGHRNAAGEWCCGEGDCFVLPASHVRARADGYHIVVRQTVVTGTVETTSTRAEIVPYAEAQPSPDGAYWRCRRPDGTRRCFFAPPPNA